MCSSNNNAETAAAANSQNSFLRRRLCILIFSRCLIEPTSFVYFDACTNVRCYYQHMVDSKTTKACYHARIVGVFLRKSIESSLRPKITAADTNPTPKAKVSGGILNGKAVNLVKPTYPAAGRASRASGKVEVQIVFDEIGKVIWARAISGHPD